MAFFILSFYSDTMKTMEKKIIIFTDGSSLGNPGPGGHGAILSLPDEKVVELGGYEKETTNNRMEMTAVIKALTHIKKLQVTSYKLQVFTDSSYLLNGITKWIHGWHQNNWKTKAKEDVLNKDLWQELFSLVYPPSPRLRRAGSNDLEIDWKLVKGHVGIVGNERADLIATTFAERKPTDLFEGTLKAYEEMLGESLLKIPEEVHVHPKRAHSKAYSYVSLVDGKIETHQTWEQCEKRVKGVSGAKYKKTISKKDEEEIIKSFSQQSLNF